MTRRRKFSLCLCDVDHRPTRVCKLGLLCTKKKGFLLYLEERTQLLLQPRETSTQDHGRNTEKTGRSGVFIWPDP